MKRRRAALAAATRRVGDHARAIRVVIGCAVGVVVFVVGLQVWQGHRVMRGVAEARELHEARQELSNGVQHLLLAGGVDSPFRRGEGVVRVRQGTQRLARVGERQADRAGQILTERAQDFAALVTTEEAALDAGFDTEVRAALYAVERGADVVEKSLQRRLGEMANWNRRDFWGVLAAAAGLLGGLGWAVARLGRAGREAERERYLRERRFQRMAESLPQLVWTSTAEGRPDYLSPRWLAYTGRGAEEQLGEGWLEGVHVEDRERYRAEWAKAVAAGGEFRAQMRLRRHDGVYRWFDVRALPLLDEQGQIVEWLGASNEVQEEHELREGIERERNLSAAIIDSLPGAFYLYNRKGEFLRWNRNFEEVSGYTSNAVRGMHPLDFFFEEEKAVLAERIGRVFQTGMATVEARLRAKDGTLTPYYWTGVRVQLGKEECLLGVGIDISERVAAERALRHLNETLEDRVAERTRELEAKHRELETFTYSVSHDLKAPLRGIDGYSRLLLEDHAKQLDEEGRHFLTSVRKASIQMGDLIDDLLEYSRVERQVVTQQDVDLATLVEQVIASYGPELEQAGVTCRVEVPRLQVRADASAMAMCLRNLVDNAIKFSRAESGSIIEIGARAEGDGVVLWVKDSGIGFDMKFAERIFEIFQRLHRAEDYPGTGIGLAIVRKAMERMGGKVWAKSSPSAGATFYLKFSAVA